MKMTAIKFNDILSIARKRGVLTEDECIDEMGKFLFNEELDSRLKPIIEEVNATNKSRHK